MICCGSARLGGKESEDDVDRRRREHKVGGFRGRGGDHVLSYTKSELILLRYWVSEVRILLRGETVNMKAKDVRVEKKIVSHNLIYRDTSIKISKFKIVYL